MGCWAGMKFLWSTHLPALAKAGCPYLSLLQQGRRNITR